MIEQRLDGFDKADRVRQLGVTFERRHVPPAGVNVELVRIAQRMKATVAQATGFLAGRGLHFVHGPMHFALLSRTGVKPRKHEYLHYCLR